VCGRVAGFAAVTGVRVVAVRVRRAGKAASVLAAVAARQVAVVALLGAFDDAVAAHAATIAGIARVAAARAGAASATARIDEARAALTGRACLAARPALAPARRFPIVAARRKLRDRRDRHPAEPKPALVDRLHDKLLRVRARDRSSSALTSPATRGERRAQFFTSVNEICVSLCGSASGFA